MGSEEIMNTDEFKKTCLTRKALHKLHDNELLSVYEDIKNGCFFDPDPNDVYVGENDIIEELKDRNLLTLPSTDFEDRDDRSVSECCDICGNTEAKYVIDPFEQEVHYNIVMVWLCDHCYHESCMDI